MSNSILKSKEGKINRVYFISLIALILIALGFLAFNGFFSTTGRVTFNINLDYELGEPILGELKFNVREGELVPLNSKIKIDYGNQSKLLNLRDLILDDTISGEFYTEGGNLSGSGEGYGVIGSIVNYPNLTFDLLVYYGEDSDSENSNESETGEDSGDNSGDSSSGEIDVNVSDGNSTISNETSSNETISESNKTVSEGNGTIVESNESSNQVSDSVDSNESSSEDSSSEENTVGEGQIVGGDITESESEEQIIEEQSEAGVLTGNVVSQDRQVISGVVSKGNNFEFNLEDGQKAKILPGSVKVNGESLPESSVNLKVKNGKAIVSTDYFVNEKGFGERYLGEYGLSLVVDLSKLNLVAQEGDLVISLVYGDEIIASKVEEISINKKSVNNITIQENVSIEANAITLIEEIPLVRINAGESRTLNLSNYFSGAEEFEFKGSNISSEFKGDIVKLTPDEGFKGARSAKFIAKNGNNSLESNEFKILVGSAINIKTSREKIKVGEKVKWTKNISVIEGENVSVDLPGRAENISVKKVEQGEVKEAKVAVSGLTGGAISPLTGQVTIDLELEKEPKILRWWKNLVKGITGRAISDLESNEENTTLEVVLNDSAQDYVIEYFTDAPTSVEVETSNGKIVNITGPDDVAYEDVIAFTELSNNVPVSDSSRIKIYWVTYNTEVEKADIKTTGEVQEIEVVEEVNESTSELVVDEINFDEIESNSITGNVVQNQIIEGLVSSETESNTSIQTIQIVRQEIPFDAYDLDEDGNIDYIEWVVPHLSTQTFEIILANSQTGIRSEGNFSHLSISTSSPYDSLEGYWSFDYDNATTAFDFTNRDNDGTYVNAIKNSTNGVYGQYSQFDGTGDYINLGNNYKVGTNRTLTGWVYFNVVNKDQAILTKEQTNTEGSWTFWFDDVVGVGPAGNNDKISYAVFGPSGRVSNWPWVSSATAIQTGRWYHVAIVHEWGKNLSLYLNGVDDSGYKQAQTYTPLINENVNAYIGATQAGTYRDANAKYDELMIFNTTLTPQQILDIYNNQSARFAVSGEQSFTGVNFNGENLVNFSLSDCQTNFGSSLQAKVNDGEYTTMTNCAVSDYSASGDLSSATVSINYSAGTNQFYTPIASGNLSLVSSVSDSVSPSVLIISPQNISYGNLTQTISITSSDDNEHYTFADVDNSLVGMWRFEGNYADDSGNGNTGTANGNTFINSSGRFGSTAQFDGSGDYVDTNAKIIASNSTYTLMAWAYRRGTGEGSYPTILGQGQNAGFLLTWENLGIPKLYHNRGGFEIIQGEALNNNQWYHLTGLWNGTDIELYVNGIRVSQASVNNLIATELNSLKIGRYDSGTPDYFNGSIDEVLIFNRSLSAGEISALYNATASQYSTDYTFSSAGSHSVEAYSVDAYGNMNNSESVTFSIDQTVPAITFSDATPANASTVTDANFTVGLTTSDENGEHYALTDFDNSLVGWWRFEGDYNDDLGLNNGTANGNALINSSGRFGSTAQFDGSGDYIEKTSPSAETLILGNMTISHWIKVNSLPSAGAYKTIIGRGENGDTESTNFVWGSFITNSGGAVKPVSFWEYTSGANELRTGTTSLSLNQWIHLVQVRNVDTNQVTFYVNGIAESPISYTGDPLDGSATTIRIGYSWSAGQDFNGSIDEVLIFNRSLSAGEISALYNATATQYSNEFTGLSDGEHTFTGYAVDQFGNKNETELRSVTVSTDSVVPEVTILSPENVTYTNLDLPLVFNVSLNEAGSVSYSLDSGTTNVSMTDSGSNYFNASVTGLATGSYTFRVYAQDSNGNKNESESLVFSFVNDTSAPNLTLGIGSEIDNYVGASGENIYVNVSASDSNEDSITFNLYNSTGLVNSTTFTDGTREINWSSLGGETYYYNITINDTSGNVNYTTTRTSKLIISCLSIVGSACTEGSYCNVANKECYLSSDVCDGGLCDFESLTATNSKIYTLYNSSGDGKVLDINITNTNTKSRILFSGSEVIFNGKNGSDISGAESRGGNAGILNITVPRLLNTTNFNLTGIGGYSTASGIAGGNGGIVQINAQGLIRNWTETDPDFGTVTIFSSLELSGGSSLDSGAGTGGILNIIKKIFNGVRDTDVDGDGYVGYGDRQVVEERYNNISTDDTFSTSADIKVDEKINIIDLSRVGFEYNTRT